VPVQGVYRNVLRHAASVAGEKALAGRLRVSPFTLESWLSGKAQIPSDVFLAVTDYLAEVQPPDAAKPPGSGTR
jgi:DNA-binding transcriptional regulator YdaS (Cro superfamily)